MKEKDSKLDADEQKLLESIERGEWTSVENLDEEMVFAKKAAENFQRKDTKINIRVSGADLAQIKRIAAYEGLPYQTLISSILHKYACGTIKGNDKLS